MGFGRVMQFRSHKGNARAIHDKAAENKSGMQGIA